MPTYTILCKDKSTLSIKETQVKANNEKEAKQIVEGRGQQFIIIKNINK